MNQQYFMREIEKQASFGGRRTPTEDDLKEAAKNVLEVMEFWTNQSGEMKRIRTLEELRACR